MNNFNTDFMRTEIAILQEKVDPKNPGTAKFKIPVLMTDDTVAKVSVNNNNILNRRNGNLKASSVSIDNTVDLFIPTQLTYFLDIDYVPVNTKFVVTFVGGNPNDIRIIALYDTDL